MRRVAGRVLAYLILIALGIGGAAPFLYLLVLSGKKRIEILSQVPPTLGFQWSTIAKTLVETRLRSMLTAELPLSSAVARKTDFIVGTRGFLRQPLRPVLR